MWSKTLLDQGRQHLPVPARKHFLYGELLDLKQLFSGVHCCPLIPNLGIVIRLSTAHPARAMNFSFGKSPCGATRPCKDVLFISKLAENLFLAMDRTFTLLTIVTAVSVQLCSLLDSSGCPQESSRKYALLQAAYLARGKNVNSHYFDPSYFGYCTSDGAVKQVFSPGEPSRICIAINKEKLSSHSRHGWLARQTPLYPRRRPCRCSGGSGHRPHTSSPALPRSPACRCRNAR